MHKLLIVEITKFTSDSFFFFDIRCDLVADLLGFLMLDLIKMQVGLPLIELASSFPAVFCLLLLLLKRGLLFVLIHLKNCVLPVNYTHPFHPDFFQAILVLNMSVVLL